MFRKMASGVSIYQEETLLTQKKASPNNNLVIVIFYDNTKLKEVIKRFKYSKLYEFEVTKSR